MAYVELYFFTLVMPADTFILASDVVVSRKLNFLDPVSINANAGISLCRAD